MTIRTIAGHVAAMEFWLQDHHPARAASAAKPNNSKVQIGPTKKRAKVKAARKQRRGKP
jgi:hypothetical protein